MSVARKTQHCQAVIFLPNLIYFLDLSIYVLEISIKTPANYFTDIDELILKFIWKGIVILILKEKNKVRRLTLFDLKIYYKATVIKTGWYS